MSNVLIFGATSAIAHAAARRWADRGASVYLVGRDPAKLDAVAADLRARAAPDARVLAAAADLDRLDAHAALVETAFAALGGVDTVLVAHGSLPDQKRCEADVAETLAQLTTNGSSVVSLCTLVAPRLAAQRGGCLAVITSVAGDRGRQSNYVYGAAKGMVSRFLEGLRHRLWRDGVAVLDIRPGFVATPMTAALDRQGPLWATADRVAGDIVGAVERRRAVLYTPGFWRPIMAIVRSLPRAIFHRSQL